MSVDLHEYKFILELEDLEPFVGVDPDSSDVWRVNFPAWRAPFTAHLLMSHANHYRLPGFRSFAASCQRSWTDARYGGKYRKWFRDPYYDQTKRRLRFFYESGIAEAYLYSCLVDAIEDQNKDGFVFYDARMDWKQKGDVWVTSRNGLFVIDAFTGDPSDRDVVKLKRERNEREQKTNTERSAHWGNSEHERWIMLQISRNQHDAQVVNGFRLFSIQSVNKLLQQIYRHTGRADGFEFPISRDGRRRVYHELISSR